METDGEVQLMYFLFRYHNITPTQFKAMGQGEKRVVRQFMFKELEDRDKEKSSIFGALGGM